MIGLSSSASEYPKRLASHIEESQTFSVADNTARQVERGVAIELGPASGATLMPRLFLHFSASAAQRSDLAELLKAQQDRGSPQFHQFLTPEQFADRFGANSADVAKVTRWLEESGFSKIEVARGRTWVSFSGSVAQAESAFHTAIRRYSLSGEIHLANISDPRLPKAFEGFIDSVHGLHNFHLKPRVRRRLPQYTQPSTSVHYLTADDWATIYDVKPLYSAGLDGSGVSIAVVGQSDVLLSDIAAFRSASGLPANAPTVVIPPGQPDPGIQSDDELESDLDLEWSGAIAKRATILFITSGDGVQDAIAYAIDNNVAPILSTSYGVCELDETQSEVNSQNGLYQQANAQGMTILAAAGDQGATDCDSSSEPAAIHGLVVDYPASSPYVTGIGGSEFNEGSGNYWSAANNDADGSALSYIPEIVWNDGFQEAAGGGFSIFGTKPSWQAGPGVPADNARDVPDIAFTASPRHDGFLICGHNWCSNGFFNSSSSLDVVGGTSTGPPSFAGVLALVIQKNGVGTSLGNINPNLYSLAQISTNIFHDVTQGNNKMPCQTGSSECPSGASPIGYSAGAGYDQTTGWGSLDAYNFAEQYYANIRLTPSPAALTIQPGSSATSTINVAPENAFSGNISFTCSVSTGLAGVTCSVPGTVNTSGTVTVTITAASSAHLTPPPTGRRLPLLLILPMVLAMLLFAAFASGRKARPFPISAVYACSSACLVAIALGAVSCGGGGSTAASAPAVTDPVLTLTCNLPSGGSVGAAYSGSCSASGGDAPIVYSISGGSLPAGLTINSATGAITGTPSAPGSVSFTVKATDSGSPQQTASQIEPIAVAPASLTLACTLPPMATAASPYSGGCLASGGTTPVTYSISAGALPAGLSINSATGAITGMATALGNSSFTVRVSDSGAPIQTASQTGSIVVVPALLTLACALPPTATALSSYTGGCVYAGGTTPVTYSISAGTLPIGLSMNAATGVISGTPSIPGTSSFTVKAADSGSPQQVATQAETIVVAPAGLTLACTLSNASVMAAYSGSCTGTGGTTPLTYTIGSGTLPPGLSLNAATGAISGIPTTAGTSSFAITVKDSGSPVQTATQTATITVAAITPLTLNGTLAVGNVGQAYSGQLVASGGNAPYTFSVTAGALPAGLTLNASSGLLSGIPTTLGHYAFSVSASDSSSPVKTTAKPFNLTVGEVGTVTITATSGGIVVTTSIAVTIP